MHISWQERLCNDFCKYMYLCVKIKVYFDKIVLIWNDIEAEIVSKVRHNPNWNYLGDDC